ncbi:MAG: nitroreductase family protein [bacterium]
MMRNLIGLCLIVFVNLPVWAQESLPPVNIQGKPFEILSNSRYSVHSGFTSSLSSQVLSNILWAMSRVPSLGSGYREIYVATPENVYRYNPDSHNLITHLAGNHRYSANSAFEIGIAVERYEEAGMVIQAGLLAAVSFWDSAAGSVTSCPMQFATNYANSNWNPNHPILMVNVYGQRTGTGLTDSCVARSSDSTLPLPATTGSDTFELLLTALDFDTIFEQTSLPMQTLSQLLWAGYGVTPHMTTNGRRGTTIPSAIANYYLTGRIYLVSDSAVFRYHNRLPPGNNLTTSDHRLELLIAEDRRDSLRAACPRLPQTAPDYIIICVGDTSSNYAMIEAGFAAFQFLLQAKAQNLGAFLAAPLSVTERSVIKTALNLTGSDQPVFVFAAGEIAVGIQEQLQRIKDRTRIRQLPGLPVQLEFWISGPGQACFTISDLTGRAIATWAEIFSSPGWHKTCWQGTDNYGNPVSAGIYIARVTTSDCSETIRIILTR